MEAQSPRDFDDITNEELVEAILTVKSILLVFKGDVCPNCRKYIQQHLIEIYKSLPNMN